MPAFKTIADFRRDNGPVIRAACGQFVVLCRQLSLFTRAVVAVDGGKFKAVNNRYKNFTVAKVAKRIEQVEASIARYLAALGDGASEAKTTRIRQKIEGLWRQMQPLKVMEKQVEEAPDKQISLTDPDVRSMATSGKGTGMVGYNVQIAVDAEHHLIVAHEEPTSATIGRNWRRWASRRAMRRDAKKSPSWRIAAITMARKRCLARERAEHDRYACPAGAFLTKGKTRSGPRDDIDHYRNLTACPTCGLKAQCTLTNSNGWAHEGMLDAMQARLDRMNEDPPADRRTSLGNLEGVDGQLPLPDQDPCKGQTEMSLQVLAYNMKRMINIFGIKPLLQAIAD